MSANRIVVRQRKGNYRKSWQVLYRDTNYRRRSKQFATEKEAWAWGSQTSVDVKNGVHVPETTSVTVSEAGKQWLSGLWNIEQTTAENYEGHLRKHIYPALGSLKLSDLSVAAVSRFRDALLMSGLSPETVRKTMFVLKKMLSKAALNGLTAKNPARELEPLRNNDTYKIQVGVDVPTIEEVRKIIHVAEGRWRPMILTLIFTGMRSGELRALRWADVDFRNRAIHVRHSVNRYGTYKPPKTKAGTRSIPVGEFLLNTLREWKLSSPPLKAGAPNNDLVFPNREGRVIAHYQLIWDGLLPTLEKAGLVTMIRDGKGKPVRGKSRRPNYEGRYMGTHAFRHFYCTWLLNRKVDGGLELPSKIVQYRMGHSTSAMTNDRYGHLMPQADDPAQMAAAERSLLGL